jgi:hypothetical protein
MRFEMALIQFDLFKTEEQLATDELRDLIEDVRQSGDKVRKGVYAKLNELTKECRDLKVRLEVLERHICKGAC